jgi:FPC/CPF motif-containing protein YcgG
MTLPVAQHTVVKRRQELLTAISDDSFPCLGGKSALARGMLGTLVCQSLGSARDDARIHSVIVDWANAYQDDPRGLRSLAVVFDEPAGLSEERFEALMWERLQSLANHDQSSGQSYDPGVSPDPDDPNFALSFGGAAFFVVGMHAAASRPARRVPRPTLVFNLHDQFERLRLKGSYESMREKIIKRDVALAGGVNPMLARFGEVSGARQYSGRAVADDWRCPFRDARAR